MGEGKGGEREDEGERDRERRKEREGEGKEQKIEKQARAADLFTMVRLGALSIVKVSPDAQSIPNRAHMSPAFPSSISSILSLCMRTRRDTLTFFLVRVFMMLVPFFREPWYTRR